MELSGFRTIERTGVVVGLDRTLSLAFTLEVAGVAETVTVSGESPAIDTTGTTTGINAMGDLFNRIPFQRDIYAIARVAPGTQRDGAGTVFYGSSGAENNYMIDGLNATGARFGTEAKQLNFDFVEEIEVKTGGLPAEYGRTTGGVVNVLTRSGGNTFRGDGFAYYEGGGLQSDDDTASARPQTTTTVTGIDSRWDFGGDLSGYLIKDRLWFFGAYNRTNRTDDFLVIRDLVAPGSPPIGSVIARETRRDLFAGKMTWSPRENHRIAGSVFGDPGTVTGPVFPIAGPEVTWQGTNEIGSTDLVARYEGTFGDTLLVRALYGRHQERNTLDGDGKHTVRAVDRTVVPNAVTGGFGRHEDQEFARDVFRVDLTRFAGRHELRLGGDHEVTKSTSANWFGGGGQTISKLRHAATGRIYYRHAYYLNDLAAGFDPEDPATWQIAAPLTSEPRSKSYAAYVQDTWRVTPRLTLNLGLRYELQDVQDRFDQTAFRLDQNWAPRLGVVWDVHGNGRSKLYASYGRYFENIPQDIDIRAFGGETVCFCTNWSPSPGDILPDPSAPVPSTLPFGAGEPVDPGLKGQYVDELLGGFEYEVAPEVVLGTKVTYRTLGRAIEDMVVDPASGAYAVVNPGEGALGGTAYYYDGGSAPAPGAERRNWSFELTARKRFSRGWQLLASYVWTKLEGNYDGLYQNSTDSLAPNISTSFDHADFLVNAKGPLAAERRHQLKLDASYELTGGLKGLSLGLSAWFYSGLPLNAYGYSLDSVFWEYFLAPRGSLGRGPREWEASFHLSYPIQLSGRARLMLIADVFNLFDRQAIAELDERYNLPSDGDPCAGIPSGMCGSRGGIGYVPNSIDPIGSIPDPRTSATNPDYLENGVAFTQPRSLRLGVRFTF